MGDSVVSLGMTIEVSLLLMGDLPLVYSRGLAEATPQSKMNTLRSILTRPAHSDELNAVLGSYMSLPSPHHAVRS